MRAILKVHIDKLTLSVEAVELYIEQDLVYDEGFIDCEWNLDHVYDSVEEALHRCLQHGIKDPSQIKLEMVGGQPVQDPRMYSDYTEDEMYDHEC